MPVPFHQNHDMLFQGRRALITGGTSGIGLAVTRALVAGGCQVVATGLTQEEVDEFPLEPQWSRAVLLDVADDLAVGQLVAQLDPLWLLVNGAGMIMRDGQEHTPEGFRQVIDVNLNGTMRMCLACKPLIAAAQGSVVNIGSVYSYFGAKHAPAYSASKGGVVQLTRSLALAWADLGVRVNAVLPGWIETPFTRAVRADARRNQSILDRTPLGRWGKADEVAQAVLFLASDAASFITGTALPVDGGFSVA